MEYLLEHYKEIGYFSLAFLGVLLGLAVYVAGELFFESRKDKNPLKDS